MSIEDWDGGREPGRRISLGTALPTARIQADKYDDNFTLSLEEAQRRKHEYVSVP